ncbi:MAG TPA: helix-turn-helix transcriptional regulator [Opitutus sp.]|nr:helix-turn-helix transcriptional regulator [Opitutus sp.]
MKRSAQRGRNILGGRIRDARLKRRIWMSQADLAARLTVRGVPFDRASVTRVENGERYLRDYEIRAFATVLRVSVAWLFRETGDPRPVRR